MNSKMLFIGIGAIVVIALAGFLLVNSSPSKNDAATVPTPTTAMMMMDDTPTASQSMTMDESGTPAVSPSGTTTGKQVVKEITVTGSSFKFAPSTITVKKGDVVTIIFKNSGGMHDFVIDELGVKTKVINGGEDDTVQFVASKVGTFEYYCSVGTHRAMGMKGTITVQ